MELYAVERNHIFLGTSYMLNDRGAIAAFKDILMAQRWASRLNGACVGYSHYRVVTVSDDANTDVHPVYRAFGEELPDWR